MSELNKLDNQVPDVSSAGINGTAKQVWQTIKAQPSFTRDSHAGKYRGVTGRFWHGAVNKIVNDLWPALGDRYLVEKEQAEELKLAINRFLRHNQAVICTRDGGRVKTSTWFVAEYWPELTVVAPPKSQVTVDDVVTDDVGVIPATFSKPATPLDVFNLKRPVFVASTEERSEEEMTNQQAETNDGSGDDEGERPYGCRLDTCDLRFGGAHHRATHEMGHGFRWNEDGTVTYFSVDAPVPDEEETQELIVKVCENQKEALTQSQIVELVRKDTPKAISSTIKIVLQVMADDGWFEHITKFEGQPPRRGRLRRYRFLGDPHKRVIAKRPVKSDDAGFLETAVATLRNDLDETRLGRYRDLFAELTDDLAKISTLMEQIYALEVDNTRLKKELLLVTQQRDDALSSASGGEELERVTRERDELQGKLDTLKKALGAL